MSSYRRSASDHLKLEGTASASADPPTCLLFEIGGREYSIEVEATEGVVDCPGICPLPAPPEGIVGVASVRGRMTVVMDLSRGTSDESSKRRLVLLKGDGRLGLLADRVHGVVALDTRSVPRSTAGECAWPTLAWMEHADRKVPVLDVERLGYD